MSKNDRNWERLTADSLAKIADRLHQTANDIDRAAELLSAEPTPFDLTDVRDGAPKGGTDGR